MKVFEKIILGIVFSLLCILLLLLATIRFELLNSSFLFWSFQRNNVYTKLPTVLAQSLPNDPHIKRDEQGDYANIVNSINPQTTQRIIESNLQQILNYINGKSDDITIRIFAKDFAILDGSDIKWSLSQMQQHDAQTSENRFAFIQGLGNKILLVLFIIFSILIGLFLLYGRLTNPKSLLGGKKLVLITGILTCVLGIALRIFSFIIEKSLQQKLEPSQAILKLLASSLFPDISITWIILGGVLILMAMWFEIHQTTNFQKK